MKQAEMRGSSPQVRVARYTKFRGVDLSTDPSLTDNARSPYALNLVSDTGGNPEKRVGWRAVKRFDGEVEMLKWVTIKRKDTGGMNSRGEWSYQNVSFFLVHTPSGFYRWSGKEEEAPTLLYGHEEDDYSKATCFEMQGKIWILTGWEYLAYGQWEHDLEPELKRVEDIATVPLTKAGAAPDGESSTPVYGANLLTPKRKNSFIADGKATSYQLDAADIGGVEEVLVNGQVKKAGTDYTVDTATGKVKFTTAPPAIDPNTQRVGEDNVVITFSKEVEGKIQVTRCSRCVLFGVSNNDRVFFTGNASFPAYDWHSEWNDPTYFSETGYTVVGAETVPIMGYHRLGEYLAIIKGESDADSTIYLRRAQMATSESTGPDGRTLTDSLATFPIKQAVAGVGAISPNCFGNLMDEPLFLSRKGVYAITTSTVTGERTVQNRSYYVDAALTKEPDLYKAVATEWNGFFLVAVGGNCYVLDGKQNRSYKAGSNGEFLYECYHWDDMPVKCFATREDGLYFGTQNGFVCRMNDDMNSSDKYNSWFIQEDPVTKQWEKLDERPVVCYWATKADDDGDFMMRKSLVKRGSGVLLKPYSRSSAKVLIRTEADFGKEIRYSNMDIFDFNDIDFERFSFNTNDSPQVLPFDTRVKKYITAQIIIKNDALGEGFGIYGIIKRFTVGGYVKG